MEQLCSNWMNFHEICYLCIFRKSVVETRVSLKSDTYNGYFTWSSMYVCGSISVNFLEMRNVSDKRCRENWNTHFPFNNFFFFRKSCLLWNNVEKYCRVGQATNDSMVHTHCLLDNWGYRHTLRIRNNYCFRTVRIITHTRLNVTLRLLCLSC